MHGKQIFSRLTSACGLLWRGMLAVLVMAVCAATAGAADLALIEAVELKNSQVKWVVLDSRPKPAWEAGQIPGAIQFFWETYTRTDARGVKYSSLTPQELAAALAALGIDENSPVVIYGDADTSWGSEGYTVWLLSWLGHKGPIRLLKGGIQAWRAQKFPLVKGHERSAVPKPRYKVELKPQYLVSTEDIQTANGAFTVVDTRSTFEWFMGRIPGAVHIPWEDFHTGKDHHPLPAAELKRLMAKHKVDPSKPVVFYCLGGVRSAYAWMVYQLAGLPAGRNYKGGWAAWEKRAGE